MRKRLAVVAAFVCVGAGVMGTGIAHAATSTYVVSDKITLAAKLVPTSPPNGSFGFGVGTTVSYTHLTLPTNREV